MKKILVSLSIVFSLLCLCACSGNAKSNATYMTDEEALSLGSSAASLVSQVVSQGMEDSYVANVEYQGGDPAVYRNAFESWKNAQADIGDFLGVGKLISNSMEIDVLGNVREGTIQVELLGTSHDAVLEILCENGDISSITTNVNYSFAENMEKAGLNTLLGMGTVFCVLILISIIISMFNLIPKIQSAFRKKPAASPVEAAVDGAIDRIVSTARICSVTATSCGLFDVPTLMSIFGISGAAQPT